MQILINIDSITKYIVHIYSIFKVKYLIIVPTYLERDSVVNCPKGKSSECF